MSTPTAPAGWYPDPDMGSTRRYWDGTRWTEHRAPADQASGKAPSSRNVIVAGYVAAVMVPILGFLIGLTQLNRSTNHALGIIATSIGVFVLAWLIVGR